MQTPEPSLSDIENKIYLIRGLKVMLDSDLAALYGVTTFNLNKAVKRNIERFPRDFMFHLTNRELSDLIFQIGISSEPSGHGGRRHPPVVFTQEGVAMLSSVLRSEQAVQVNIYIMRCLRKITRNADQSRRSQSENRSIGTKIRQAIQIYFRRHSRNHVRPRSP